MNNLDFSLEPTEAMQKAKARYIDETTSANYAFNPIPEQNLKGANDWKRGYFSMIKSSILIKPPSPETTSEERDEIHDELEHIVEIADSDRIAWTVAAIHKVVTNDPYLPFKPTEGSMEAYVTHVYRSFNAHHAALLKSDTTPTGVAFGIGDEIDFILMFEIGVTHDNTWGILARIRTSFVNRPDIEPWFIRVPSK